jgi:hypothetical protein
MSNEWSHIEVELIVSDYLDMLSSELNGKPVNKTEHRSRIRPLLNNRSNGSIEFKHQNISAILIKLGLPYINGYKPRWNYQNILEEELIKLISVKKRSLEQTFFEFADAQPISIPKVDFSRMVDAAPEKNILTEPEVKYERRPIKVNFLEREQRNSILGLKGEELVLQYERWRLKNEGVGKWIDNIEWISKYDDSAGFDILSRNRDGSDRFIEVKTTKLNKDTPIFFSKNELEFSFQKKDKYFLYRLFNFNNDPKLFYLNGDFDSFYRREAICKFCS